MSVVSLFLIAHFLLNKDTNHSAYRKEAQGALILHRVRTRLTLLFFAKRLSRQVSQCLIVNAQKPQAKNQRIKGMQRIGIDCVLSTLMPP